MLNQHLNASLLLEIFAEMFNVAALNEKEIHLAVAQKKEAE